MELSLYRPAYLTIVSLALAFACCSCAKHSVQSELRSVKQLLIDTEGKDTAHWRALALLRPAVLNLNDRDVDQQYMDCLNLILRTLNDVPNVLVYQHAFNDPAAPEGRLSLTLGHNLRYWGNNNAARSVYARCLVSGDNEMNPDIYGNLAMEYLRIGYLDIAEEYMMKADSLFRRHDELAGRLWMTRLRYTHRVLKRDAVGARHALVDYRSFRESFLSSRTPATVDTTTDMSLIADLYRFGDPTIDIPLVFGHSTEQVIKLYQTIVKIHPLLTTNYWKRQNNSTNITGFPLPVIRSFEASTYDFLWADSLVPSSEDEISWSSRFGRFVLRGNRWVAASLSAKDRHTTSFTPVVNSCLSRHLTTKGRIRFTTPLGSTKLAVITRDSAFVGSDSVWMRVALPNILRHTNNKFQLFYLNDTTYLALNSAWVILLRNSFDVVQRIPTTPNHANTMTVRSFGLRTGLTRLDRDVFINVDAASSRYSSYRYDARLDSVVQLRLAFSAERCKRSTMITWRGLSVGELTWSVKDDSLQIGQSLDWTSQTSWSAEGSSISAPLCSDGLIAIKNLDNIDIIDTERKRVMPVIAAPIPFDSRFNSRLSIMRTSQGDVRSYYHDSTRVSSVSINRHWYNLTPSTLLINDNSGHTTQLHASADSNDVKQVDGTVPYTITHTISSLNFLPRMLFKSEGRYWIDAPYPAFWALHTPSNFSSSKLDALKPFSTDSYLLKGYIPAYKQWYVAPLVLIIATLGVGYVAYVLFRLRKRNRDLTIATAKSEQLSIIREDMHDMIGSRLVRIASLARQTKPEEADAALARIHDMTLVTVRSLRNLLSLMSESSMTDAEFFGALREYVNESCTDAALKATVTVSTVSDERTTLDGSSRHELMMIVSEMLANTLRHAQATTVTFSIVSSDDAITLTWQDDGVGIAPSSQRGNGLNNIQRRASRLSANVDLISHPGGGTRYLITVPLQVS
jgi:signal transduction histidine kinase